MIIRKIILLLLPLTALVSAYTTITPADLHARLVRRDTLLVLDVREVSEYTAGHIAEPAGQLPLTPANMPWNSGVLQAQYGRLPKNIDIVVQCAAGGRSASASAFLEQNGFTRVFNLSGGFNAWDGASFEKRTGLYGDHSGGWINPAFPSPDTVRSDSSAVFLYPAAFAGLDSVYIELHFAYGKQPSPSDAPVSDIAGLYRMTALDKFGLPLFSGDSLVLADTLGIDLAPHRKSALFTALSPVRLDVLIGPGKWQPVPFTVASNPVYVFHRSEKVLRRWYNLEAVSSAGVVTWKNGGTKHAAGLSRNRPPLLCDLRGRVVGPLPGHLTEIPVFSSVKNAGR